MNKKNLMIVFALFLFTTFWGCTGKGVLSQKEMDEKIGKLTREGEEALLPTLESACDKAFENLVQNYVDSLTTAAKVEKEGE